MWNDLIIVISLWNSECQAFLSFYSNIFFVLVLQKTFGVLGGTNWEEMNRVDKKR